MWFSLRVAISRSRARDDAPRDDFNRHLTGGDRNRKRYSGVAVLEHRVFPLGALRKSHTGETRHWAGPIQDVGSAGLRASVSADPRTYGVGEA